MAIRFSVVKRSTWSRLVPEVTIMVGWHTIARAAVNLLQIVCRIHESGNFLVLSHETVRSSSFVINRFARNPEH
jgi:hypothetical protein